MSDTLDGYVEGRWPAVVRFLVLLGAPPAHAARLATTAVTAFHDRVATDGDAVTDLDVVLFGAALTAWTDDRTPWWAAPGGRERLAGTGLDELEPDLDALPPPARARLVLLALGLDADGAAQVVGEAPAGAAGQASVDVGAVRAVAEAVPTGPPGVGTARARSVARRRRTTVLGVATLAVVVAATVALLVAVVDPSGPPASAPPGAPPPVPVAVDPASSGRAGGGPVEWYDGAAVHLSRGEVVPVPGVRALTATLGGAVVVLDDGRVVAIARTGGAQTLGRAHPDGAVRSSASRDVVAWVDRGTGDLVLHDLRRLDRRVALPGGARLVAVDGLSTHLRTDDTWVVVRPGAPVQVRPGPAPLDVAAGVTVFAAGPERVVVHPEGGRAFEVDGTGARLSDDGRYLLVHDVLTGAPLVVVEVATRERVAVPLPDAGVAVLDAAFGDPGEITFLAHPDAEGAAASPYELLACDLAPEPACRTTDRPAVTRPPPVLAR